MRRATAALVGLLLLACACACEVVPPTGGSGGSGGLWADRENQTFTAGNGLSSRYHIYAAGLPQNRPTGLLLQFHGDGAYEFNNPRSSYSLGGSSGIVAKAREHGLLTIAALAPDRSGSVTWWESGSANADYVRDLIERVALTRYNIDRSNIWLVGYSGGAQFVTQFFLPKYSSLISGGGSVVFGGGGAPRLTAAPMAASLKGEFPMHWYTGAADTGPGFNALSAAKSGESWYASKGFRISAEHPAGVTHSLSGRFGKVVDQQLDLHP